MEHMSQGNLIDAFGKLGHRIIQLERDRESQADINKKLFTSLSNCFERLNTVNNILSKFESVNMEMHYRIAKLEESHPRNFNSIVKTFNGIKSETPPCSYHIAQNNQKSILSSPKRKAIHSENHLNNVGSVNRGYLNNECVPMHEMGTSDLGVAGKMI